MGAEPDPRGARGLTPSAVATLRPRRPGSSSSLLLVLLLLCLQVNFHRARGSLGCLLAQLRSTYYICQCSAPALRRFSFTESKRQALQWFTLQLWSSPAPRPPASPPTRHPPAGLRPDPSAHHGGAQSRVTLLMGKHTEHKNKLRFTYS